ncbi:MAG: CpsD/CapB family tyrosine-protein kinase [Erysipelotrichaceae bacterium]|nr:CpsD/CapB family tyrosine-protein kinase [Erysipelotrichaceae bacterium]
MKNSRKVDKRRIDYRIIVKENPSSPVSESYRKAKVSLDFASLDNPLKVIQITSSLQGEGKTTTAINLAASYAEDGKKVLLVDLDLRRPKLHRAFKIENKNGIVDVLANKITLDEAIKEKDGLYLLNKGSDVPFPTSLLNSEAIASLFETLKAKFDIIIVDCPPVLAVSDAVVISKYSDGCIFVVSQKHTDKASAKQSIATLKQNNVNILGVVFTQISKKDSKDYHSSYYYKNYK